MLGFFKRESRSIESPEVQITGARLIEMLEGGDLPRVDAGAAMRVPAVFCAVTFISETIASLPPAVHKKAANGTGEKARNHKIARLLSRPSSDMTRVEFFQRLVAGHLMHGTGAAVIERNSNGDAIELFILDPSRLTIETRLVDGAPRRVYKYREKMGDGEKGRIREYAAADVIDIAYSTGFDAVSRFSPLATASSSIQLALAASSYGARAFASDGLPPVVLEGPFPTGDAAERAAADVALALSKSRKKKRAFLAMPLGHKLNSLGFKPDEMQMTELQRFLIEEFARIWSIPPAFLQDLSHGTFSNVEQQALTLVKHTLAPIVVKLEQQLELKLLSESQAANYSIKLNMDGLLRGDIKTRAEAMARQIQSGTLTPDEARALEGRGPIEGGDRAYIQGAMMPLGSQAMAQAAPGAGPADDPIDEESDDE